MSDYDLAYAAGLIDGEGSILLHRKYKTSTWRYPQISISSTTQPMLLFMKERYGGNIRPRAKKTGNKQAWEWRLNGSKAIEFCRIIEPLLLEPIKRFRCQKLVNDYPRVTSRNGKYTFEQRQAKKEFEQSFFDGPE